MFLAILPPSSSVTLGRAELLTGLFPLMLQQGQVWKSPLIPLQLLNLPLRQDGWRPWTFFSLL